MKLISLQGPEKCGKTTTIKLLTKALLQDGGVLLWSSCGITSTNGFIGYLDKKKDKGEIGAVLRYRDKTVALISVGDYPKILLTALIRILIDFDLAIDCLISASHTTGQLTKAFSMAYADAQLAGDLSGCYPKQQRDRFDKEKIRARLFELVNDGVEEKDIRIVKKACSQEPDRASCDQQAIEKIIQLLREALK